MARREWKLVGGPTTQWRGMNPDGTYIFVETANYWLYRNGECYAGPFISEKLVRSAAAQRLIFERRFINVVRNASKIILSSKQNEENEARETLPV